tara:strand:- start:171 stop:281 length:111 start_codon:yes stop_codon:yes gene_type:complete
MIKKKTIIAEEICRTLSPGGIYMMRENMPVIPQKNN